MVEMMAMVETMDNGNGGEDGGDPNGGEDGGNPNGGEDGGNPNGGEDGGNPNGGEDGGDPNGGEDDEDGDGYNGGRNQALNNDGDVSPTLSPNRSPTQSVNAITTQFNPDSTFQSGQMRSNTQELNTPDTSNLPSGEVCMSINDSEINDNDVLLGRRGWFFNHNGNINFHKLISQHGKEYKSTIITKEKTCIVKGIIDHVHNSDLPGRFLEKLDKNSTSWVVIEKNKIIEKVSQALKQIGSWMIDGCEVCMHINDDKINDNDVLHGRSFGTYIGNINFHKLISEHGEKYRSTNISEEKTRIAKQIIDHVHNSNPPGRFLQKLDKNSTTWVVIEDNKVMKKVKTDLRYKPAENNDGGQELNTPDTSNLPSDEVCMSINDSEITNNDVLLGRDRWSNYHIGNINYRTLISEHGEKYRSKTIKEEKTRIAEKIIDHVHNSNPPGRFLQKLDKNSTTWVVIEDNKVMKKVKTDLRYKPAENNDVEPDEVCMSINDGEINDNDVLLGRGGQSNYHIGNINYRNLISEHGEKYKSTIISGEKTRIAKEIIDHVHNSNPPGRFLQKLDKNSTSWVVIDEKKKMEKVINALKGKPASNERKINKKPVKGAQRKCSHPGCTNNVKNNGVCVSHGAKSKTCNHPGCTKNVHKAGLCSTHGPARKRCEVDGCEKFVQQGGLCFTHGAIKKRCEVDGCEKHARKGGVCYAHGANVLPRKRREVDGCEKLALKGGVCIAHGAKRKRL